MTSRTRSADNRLYLHTIIKRPVMLSFMKFNALAIELSLSQEKFTDEED